MGKKLPYFDTMNEVKFFLKNLIQLLSNYFLSEKADCVICI